MKRKNPLAIGMFLGSMLTVGVIVLMNTSWQRLAFANTPASGERGAEATKTSMIKPRKVNGTYYPAGRIPQDSTFRSASARRRN